MDKFDVIAADVIDIVLSKIEELYPELKPRKEYLQESENASILFGEEYYNTEDEISCLIRHELGTDEEKCDETYEPIDVQ